MHEVSLARSILETVREHAPRDETIREVTVRIGPLRWVEPESLQAGWSVVTQKTEMEGARLRVEPVPWTIRCEPMARVAERWGIPSPPRTLARIVGP